MNLFKFIDLLQQKLEAGELKDGEDVAVVPFVQNGMAYAATKTKPCRVSIAIPRDMVDENLRDLHDWHFQIIAVKKDKYNKIIEEGDNID
jgi:hypothetical protein